MWRDLLAEKSIFSLFPESVLANFSVDEHIRHVEASQFLVAKGDSSDELFIPLNVNLRLTNGMKADRKSSFGTIQAGRSANLSNFLKSDFSHYSVWAETEGSVLVIKRVHLDQWLADYPKVKDYLLKVTESNYFRSLSKEIQGLEVHNEFLIEVISSLHEVSLASQTYVTREAETPPAARYLIEGQFLFRQDGVAQKSWIAPLRTWLDWKESFDGTVSPISVLTATKSTYLEISAFDLRRIQQSHPANFETLETWILNGRFEPKLKASGNDEVDDITELFKGSIKKQTWKWRYPWVKQNDQMDCGPACLAMISQYFGKDLSIHFWRSKLSTDREGTSLFDLAVTTEKTGFISHCLGFESIEDVDPFMYPFVALRQYHYFVVYKIKKNSVIVGDPGVGIREMPLAEFKDGLEKVGLFLKPNTDFLSHTTSPSPWRHYLHLFHGLEKEMLLGLVCSLLGVFLSLVPAIISQITLDEILVEKNTDLLWIVLGVAFGTSIVSSFVAWAERYYFIFIMGKFNFRATSVFVQKMLSLPYQFFATRHVGDFTHRLSEMANLRSFVTGTLFGTILNLVTMAIYAIALFMISAKAAMIVLLLGPPLLVFPVLFSRKLSSLYGEVFTKSAEQFSFIADIVKGVAAIKSAGAEATARLRFEKKLLGLVKSENEFSMMSGNIEIFSSGYHQLVNFMILGFTVSMGISGEISAGQVISFTLIANNVFTPLLNLTKNWDHFIEMKSVLSRLNDVFLTQSDQISSRATSSTAKLQPIRGEIEFRDVWFRYGGESTDWVLKGLSFKVEPGQKVAIVGPSGSGKSTIAYLLTRMYEPTQGQILIDGRDYREYNLEWLRSQVGLLHQESLLFHGSIAENIALNAPEIRIDLVENAIQRASATGLVEKKSGGIFHQIPHGGLGFSGGEKQKIALARLFYHNPSFLILDEATSALDGVAEREILNQLRVEMKDQTVFNIAHRFSTVKESELALVLLEGKIAGFGSISYLSDHNEIFQKLFSLSPQFVAEKKVA